MEDDVSQEIDEEGALQQHAKERQKTRNKQVKHMRKESKKLAKQKAEKILEAEEETSNQLKEDSHAAAEVRLKKEKVAAEQDEHERAKKTLEAETRKKISDVEVKARDKKFAIQTKSRRTRSDVSMEERQSLGDWKRWTITTLLSTLIRDA
jgi:hypothetical protein